MIFKNRKDAGEKLAEKLKDLKNSQSIVYALPRGGVIIGNEIAKELNIPLDIVITRKVGHQFEPEYAICAIAEDGHTLCNEDEEKEANQTWLKNRFKEEQEEAIRRRKVYAGNQQMLSPRDKIVIIADDGIATGLSIRLAIKEIKHERPSKIIIAVPVAPVDVINKIKNEIDEAVILKIDSNFLGAVGAYYEDFSEVGDDDVINIMNKYK